MRQFDQHPGRLAGRESNLASRPLTAVANGYWDYIASGPGEQIDAAHYDWTWNSPHRN